MNTHNKKIGLVSLLTLLCSGTVSADNNVWTQDKLTGDWGGARAELKENGIHIDGEYTTTYQGLVKGTPEKSSDFSHRVDLFLGVDSDALGLWAGGRLNAQIIYQYADTNDFGLNSISAPNSAFYSDSDSAYISAFYYSHRFENNSAFLIGKIDAFEMVRSAPFYGGAGRHGFMNLALAAPPSGVTPPAFIGAVAMLSSEYINWTVMVYDPRDRRSDKLNFEEAFSDGVNIALTATHNTRIADRRSSISVSGTYSTEEGIDYSSIEDDFSYSLTQGKYNVRFQLSHNLVESEHDAQAAWGLYLRAALADGNPNVMRGTFSAGLGGKALFESRPKDSWGLGYFSYNFSNELQDKIDGVLPGLAMHNEKGTELFYNYQATPWLGITADIQYLKSLDSRQDNALLMGLRGNIVF